MKQAAKLLYDIGDELKKRPVLGDAIGGVAQELDETADDGWPFGVECANDLEGMEQLALEEVALVAREHVTKLSMRSEIRKTLIGISGLDHAEALARYDARIAVTGGASIGLGPSCVHDGFEPVKVSAPFVARLTGMDHSTQLSVWTGSWGAGRNLKLRCAARSSATPSSARGARSPTARAGSTSVVATA